MKALTHRQQQILDYIRQYADQHGYSPSIREIGEEFGIGSLRGVTVHLDALQTKGKIVRKNTPRSITVLDRSREYSGTMPGVILNDQAVQALAQMLGDQGTYRAQQLLAKHKGEIEQAMRQAAFRFVLNQVAA